MQRKTVVRISIIVIAFFSVRGVYVYTIVLGPQTFMQTNPDKANCRQGKIFDGVSLDQNGVAYGVVKNSNKCDIGYHDGFYGVAP